MSEPVDNETIKLLQYLSLALEGMASGGTQYFNFEIRGKFISGHVEIKVNQGKSK